MKRQGFILGCAAMLSILVTPVSGQVINPAKRARDKGEQRTNDRIDRTIDKGFDKVDEGLDKLFGKDQKTRNGRGTGSNDHGGEKDSAPGNSNGSGHSGGSGNQGSATNTDFSEYRGSAFIPGKDVLFFEDFQTARLGSGQQNWHMYEYDASDDFERPSVRSVPAASGSWLKMPRKGFVFPNGFLRLPESCTIEFDMYADPQKMSEHEGGLKTCFVAREDREEYSIYWNTAPELKLDVHPHGSNQFVHMQANTEYNGDLSQEQMTLFTKTFPQGWKSGAVNHVAISRNGSAVKLFLNGKEHINLPNGLPKKGNYNFMMATNLYGDGIYFTNLRIAGNVPNAKNDMATHGKFVTNAIYFDVNSARIKAESWATLNQAAAAIKSVSGNILIVGHTDSDGSAAANITLSQNRAASVKNALVKEFGIDGARLLTDGKGAASPVENNNTAAGNARNRRVEFIKQ